jgi:hypothetical protein
MGVHKSCAFCGGPVANGTDEFCCAFCAMDDAGRAADEAADVIELTPIPKGWESIDGGIETDYDQAVDEDNGEGE